MIQGCGFPMRKSQATLRRVITMYNLPDERGHFGQFGGVFVAETLVHALNELREAYEKYQKDPDFFAEYERLTGAPLDREAIRAFSALGLASLMAMTYTGLQRYVDGRNTDFRRAWARFGLPGMRQELAVLMGW